jgi:predicted ATPase
LLGQLGEAYSGVLEQHHRLIADAVERHEGIRFGTEGDAVFAVFTAATDAVAAAVDAQRALATNPWPDGQQVRVRMGIHTGEGALGGENYVGLDVHRTARITAAGHGGQILTSDAARALADTVRLADVSFRDLGQHRLKDLAEPERLFQVVADGMEQAFPQVRTVDARPGNLPTQLTSFIGRERELEDVKDTLRRSRLLTLTGPGGTGKTRLSLQVATEVQPDYRDGAFFVALGPITDPMLVPTTIAQALGLREAPGRSPIETVVEHLRDRELLLVLDNYEQLLDAAALVGELLAETSDVRVIVTSREALRIHGEQEYPVPPLRLPDVEHLPALDALSQYEAVQLFVQRAAAVKPGFEVTNDNAPAVAEICARLDGLPLAIELAAARVKLLAPEAILKRLGHRLDLLSGGARDLPARQQTLRGAIDWSYELLDEPEQLLFARLAVFSGGFTLEAVETICGPGLEVDTFDGIASLVNKSLVRQRDDEHGGDTRFFTLQTIWEYAAERLAEHADGEEIHRRHARYFLEMTRTIIPELMGPRQAELLDRCGAEHDNLRGALEWSLRAGEIDIALELAGSLWRFWQMRGYLLEASERLRTVIGHPAAERYPEALAIALEGAGGIHYWMADWDRAQSYYERCLELRRTLDDRGAIAEALYNLSFLFTVPPPPRQDLERGRELFQEALDIYREVDDRRGIAKVAWAVSNTYTVTTQWEQSMPAAREAVDLFRELDDRFGLGWALHGVGIAATFLGRFEEARSALTESLELFAAAGDVTGIALVLNDFALLEGSRGDHERATRLHGAAVQVQTQAGQRLVTNFDELYPQWAGVVRGALSAEDFDRFHAEGEAMSLEGAVAYARKEP